MYAQKKSPLEYGILYTEKEGNTAETIWYETADKRNEAVEYIKENGHIEAGNLFSNRGRIIEIYSFSVINAMGNYYVRNLWL